MLTSVEESDQGTAARKRAALALVVIYAADVVRSKQFYETLGLTFAAERHGKGPDHFACQLDNLVFEIYPRSRQSADQPAVRLGFRVASVDDCVNHLVTIGAQLTTPPQDSLRGRRAVLVDPDGYTIEITSTNK